MPDNHQIIDFIETKLARVGLREDGIMEMRFLQDEYIVDVEDQIEMQKAAMKLSNEGEHRYHVLVLPGKYGSVSKEAREYEVFENGGFIGAKSITVVVSSLPQRIFGTLYFSFKKNKLNIPHKLVSSEQAALDWIKDLD